VSRLRRWKKHGVELAFPALAGWANLLRAYGAGKSTGWWHGLEALIFRVAQPFDV